MKHWTIRDWTGVVCGWAAGVVAWITVPAGDTKFLIVFLSAFSVAWFGRLLLPR